MQLQIIHKSIQFVLKPGSRAIKDIIVDLRVDEDSKVGDPVALAFYPLVVLGSCS
jgi:hypothetical protein